MRATAALHERGQSLWLDNITRRMLDSGQMARYVDEYSITGLTSNPSIFDKAIESGDYDAEIREKAARGVPSEELFFDIAIEDLRRAADLFLPVHQRTDGVERRRLRSPRLEVAEGDPPLVVVPVALAEAHDAIRVGVGEWL